MKLKSINEDSSVIYSIIKGYIYITTRYMIKISPNPSDMILIDISRFEKYIYDIYHISFL